MMELLLLGDYPDDLVDRLRRDHSVRSQVDPDEILTTRLIADADLVVLRSPHAVTEAMLAAASNLRWIVRAGSGTDNIPDSHERYGVEVFTTPLNSWSVAELAFGMLFSLYRDLRPLHESVLAGRWEKYQASGREVRGATLGILGFGRIGRAVAEIGDGFDMEIRAYDRSPQTPPKGEAAAAFDVTFTDLDAVLETSEVVVICLPLNEQSRRLIDGARLDRMREGSVLINVGRGEIVDIDALYQTLSNGPLAGAGLDVYPDEPPAPHPIIELDNVVCTPHVGAQTEQARGRIDRAIVEIVDDLATDSHTRVGPELPGYDP